ncbi:MAG: methyltransferase domain-containing protein [Chloroflexi bacterium]|nr:methyltransferase domain-containing protein [Chloroflexota bacterium]
MAIWILPAVALVAALLYWLLIITEGTYLGTRAVVVMYDWTARRYNRIKRLHSVYEVYFLGVPMLEALAAVPDARVLDVATGTGRLPAALVTGDGFPGQIVGVDHSRPMLVEAAGALDPGLSQVAWVQGDAHALMFADAVFDGVACLEALEFMRDPRAVVREMIRVLKPGGIMLVSNRIGWESWFFPGRYCRRGAMERLLRRDGMEAIDTHLWQTYYDLIWCAKPRAGIPEDLRGADEA